MVQLSATTESPLAPFDGYAATSPVRRGKKKITSRIAMAPVHGVHLLTAKPGMGPTVKPWGCVVGS
jgi:hypothetical protein